MTRFLRNLPIFGALLFSTAIAQVPHNGLMAWYPFEGNTNDASGNGYHGIPIGGTAVTDRHGAPASAWQLNGAGQYISLPVLAIPFDLSISFWVKTSAGNPNLYPAGTYIIDRDQCGGSRDWSVCMGGGGKVQFNTGIPDVPLTAPQDVNTGEWTHVAVTRDIIALTRSIYINGVLVAQEPWNNKRFLNNTERIFIGASVCDTPNRTFYAGDIDDVAIYARVLGATEIEEIYLYTTNTPPVAQCRNLTVEAAANCTAFATIDNGSYDPDGDPITVTLSPPGPYPLGTTEVTLTVTDNSNASAMCTAEVSVADNTPPVVRTKSFNAPLVNGVATITYEDIDNASYDLCGIASMSVKPESFTCENLGENTVTLTVRDGSGNTATGTATVTVTGIIPAPIITVTPSPAVQGGNPNTIYRGFGPQSVRLQAVGGRAYRWSSVPEGFSSTDPDPEVSPSATTSYTVIAENNDGCEGASTITVAVADATCGKNGDKVLVCHKGKSICISAADVPDHLAHGDRIGDCAGPVFGAGGFAAMENACELEQNYPNPFNPTTTIRYRLAEQSQVTLTVFDAQMRMVATLVRQEQPAGSHSIDFDGAVLPSGLYFYRLTAGGESVSRAMLLLK